MLHTSTSQKDFVANFASVSCMHTRYVDMLNSKIFSRLGIFLIGLTAITH